jgi:hypothetical protein
VHLAGACAEAELEMIAGNELRLLRCPAIITALYLNPRTRMSTASRAVELAVRNDVRVEGIPSFDEVKAAILDEGPSKASADDAFSAVLQAAEGVASEAAAKVAAVGSEDQAAARAAATDEAAEELAAATDEENLARKLAKMNTAEKIRAATLGNGVVRAILIRSPNKSIAMAAVRSPLVTEHEAERYAGNRSLNEDVVRYLAGQRQFLRRYSVKVNLVNNPKCPLQAAITLLVHLQPRELRALARSKGVSSALAKAAQSLMLKRGGRD